MLFATRAGKIYFNRQLTCFVAVFTLFYKELFFRGFLFSGFSRTFPGPAGAIIITSLTWSLMHTYYDAYGVITILFNGVTLGLARQKTGSVLLTIMLHSFMNLVGAIETIMYVSLKT